MYKIYNSFIVECYAVVLLYITYKMFRLQVVSNITCVDIFLICGDWHGKLVTADTFEIQTLSEMANQQRSYICKLGRSIMGNNGTHYYPL